MGSMSQMGLKGGVGSSSSLDPQSDSGMWEEKSFRSTVILYRSVTAFHSERVRDNVSHYNRNSALTTYQCADL